MPAFDFFNHLLNFVAPACVVALILALAVRCSGRAQHALLPWGSMLAINALLGTLVLALGTVWTGQDGRVGTYALLVLSMGTCQWWLAGGWRR